MLHKSGEYTPSPPQLNVAPIIMMISAINLQERQPERVKAVKDLMKAIKNSLPLEPLEPALETMEIDPN